MTEAPATTAPRSAPTPPFILAFVAVVALALVAAAVKGSSVDEFWTLGFADARLPWSLAFEAWSRDTGHPVGYYWFARLLDPVLADTIFVRRASNLVFVAVLAGFAWVRRRDGFAWLFACALLAHPYLIERFAEFRASFSALMCVAVVALAVRHEAQRDRIGWSAAVPALALAAAMVLDYPVGLAGCAICGAWALTAFFSGRRMQAAVAVGSALIGLAMMGLGMLNASRYPMLPAPYTQTTPGIIEDVIVLLALAVAPLAVPLAASVSTLRRVWRDDAFADDRNSAILFGSALAIAIVGYFALNLITHALIRRQLLGLVPIATALLCTLCWPVLRQSGWRLIALAVANLLIVAAAVPFWLKGKTGFDTFGPHMAAAQQACPTLPIYGVKPQDIDGTVYHNAYPGVAEPVELGLPIAAQAHGVRLATARPRRVDPACGAIVWSEFFWGPAPTAQQIAGRIGLVASPSALANSRIDYRDHSFILVVPGGSQP